MKKWTYNIVCKTVAVLLTVISLFAAVFSAVGIVTMLDSDGYRLSLPEMREKRLMEEYRFFPSAIAHQYHNNSLSSFRIFLSREKEEYDFSCTLRKEDGQILYTDYLGESYEVLVEEQILITEYRDQKTITSTVSEEKGTSSSAVGEIEEFVYTVVIYGFGPKQGTNAEWSFRMLEMFYRLRYAVIPVCLSCAVLFFFLTVFLCCSAGRKGDRKEVKRSFFDRVPLELYCFAGVAALFLQLVFLSHFDALLWFRALSGSIFFLLDCFLLLFFVMTLSVRIKTGTFLSGTVSYRVWKLISEFVKRIWENVRLVPKVALVLGGIALFDLCLATVLEFTEFLAAALVEGLVVMGILIWYAASIERLENDQKHLSQGELDHRCEVSRLPPGLRSFGDALNRSAEGLEKAMEEKMKSERFKTELITNVSHDIKTPLTSIINYVDLLKKEEIENRTVQEYLSVLDRQSSRLKKLTEDLVESSKAASGVLPVELAPCDCRVLMEQILGEYQEQLEERGLVPCFSLSQESVLILADGKRLWRVLDNLINNIVKYALPGTRVYGTLERKGDQVEMIFRNISKAPLPFGGEELTERFFRGDTSRNTEGSGLGLAIAKSLVELQKGSFQAFVDGDLFKVVITFPAIS